VIAWAMFDVTRNVGRAVWPVPPCARVMGVVNELSLVISALIPLAAAPRAALADAASPPLVPPFAIGN